MVHAAQLAGEGAPGASELAPCESGHAGNHGRSKFSAAWDAGCGKVRGSLSDPPPALRIEYAEVSLLGRRNDNQDRVSVAVSEHSALLVVIDGMGGHSDGAQAPPRPPSRRWSKRSGTRRSPFSIRWASCI